jgi:hypothetical protein
MTLTADPVLRLTRAYAGARVYQGLLFCFVLVHNLTAVLREVGYPNPRLQMWLTLAVLVAAGTLGTYCRWRFGRVEPQKRSLAQQVVRATVFALLLMTLFVAIVVGARQVDARPMDLVWLLLSAGTATSLAISRGERLGWVTPLLASALLLVTLVVPALQPYRALGHAGMAAALVVTAVQLHLFVVRGFRYAHV